MLVEVGIVLVGAAIFFGVGFALANRTSPAANEAERPRGRRTPRPDVPVVTLAAAPPRATPPPAPPPPEPQTFRCTACAGLMRVPAEFADRKVRCPTCQAVVTAPAPPAAPAATREAVTEAPIPPPLPRERAWRDDEDRPRRLPRSAPREPASSTPWGLIIGLSPERLALVVLLVVGGWLFLRFQADNFEADQPRIAEKLRWEMDAKGKKEPWFGEKKGFDEKKFDKRVFDDKKVSDDKRFEDKKVVDEQADRGQEGSQGTAGVSNGPRSTTGLPSP